MISSRRSTGEGLRTDHNLPNGAFRNVFLLISAFWLAHTFLVGGGVFGVCAALLWCLDLEKKMVSDSSLSQNTKAQGTISSRLSLVGRIWGCVGSSASHSFTRSDVAMPIFEFFEIECVAIFGAKNARGRSTGTDDPDSGLVLQHRKGAYHIDGCRVV